MKTSFLLSFSALLFIASCQKADAPPTEVLTPEEVAVSGPDSRQCASMEVLEQQISADPARGKRLEAIEAFTQKAISAGTSRIVGDTMEIPVVVHVLYKTAAENISDAQVASQIVVLNEDFKNQNADTSKVPLHFKDEQTSMPIRFVLSQVIRKATSKKSWGTNDAMKKTSLGGSDPVSPSNTLNMWACNLGQGLLGYAQFPGGPLATDGVVVLYSAFGSRAKAAGTYVGNYDLGRTATHEVGHWLNMRHIWGDATCGSDLVDDTPQHNTSNGGCPAADHKSTCTGTPLEMWMNYMDYTYDACMYMFTTGQKTRAMAVFAVGGPRESFR
ncbi:MAG: zinc metalloprotease [Chitinophagaceae bacterium]